MLKHTLLLIIALAALSCQEPSRPHRTELRVTEIATPAGESSRFSRLHGSDRTLLSWIEDLPEGGHALFFATLRQSAFDGKRRVSSGKDWFVNWADFPSVVALDDDRVAAHWLERTGEGVFAYGVRIACSQDGGATWGTPFWLHRDDSETEHGFATLVPMDDHYAAVWLDGRLMPAGGNMTLRTTTFDAQGHRGAEVVLDDRTCECCATAAGIVEGELIVAYRDRESTEIRDIAVVSREAGEWTLPSLLHEDGWEMPG